MQRSAQCSVNEMRIFSEKIFASDIFCAGAKFNVTLSIMTLNSDVFLSISSASDDVSSVVCLSVS